MDTSQWKEIAQCPSNNITTIVAHPSQEQARKRHATGLFVPNLNTMQKTTAILAPKEKL
jgi:hypothetical protein